MIIVSISNGFFVKKKKSAPDQRSAFMIAASEGIISLAVGKPWTVQFHSYRDDRFAFFKSCSGFAGMVFKKLAELSGVGISQFITNLFGCFVGIKQHSFSLHNYPFMNYLQR
jgi:hypothetical protein